MNKRILGLVESVEDAFYRHNCQYCFENGIIYDDNGNVESIDNEALKNDTHDIILQLEYDSKNLIDDAQYQKVRENMIVLERLMTLYNALND